ncbi:uncharacterized protein [Periplaneta americana]|uniref:uncharacterized protein isoform X2 n=1 Tax=Periplaneta americana TaxID=6978 RepID=UPI0037E9940F
MAIGMVDPVIEYETPAQHKYKLALARSFNIGKPIRVIRGSDLTSLYAPKFGYRYDGLYIVKKYWKRIDDCSVCKYALKRCDDQPSPPWSTECIKVEDTPVGDSCTNHVQLDHVTSAETVESCKLSSIDDDSEVVDKFDVKCIDNSCSLNDSSEAKSVFSASDVRVILQRLSNSIGNSVIFKSDNKLKSCLKKSKKPMKKHVYFRVGATRHIYSYGTKGSNFDSMKSKPTDNKNYVCVDGSDLKTFSPSEDFEEKVAKTKLLLPAIVNNVKDMPATKRLTMKKKLDFVHSDVHQMQKTTDRDNLFGCSVNGNTLLAEARTLLKQSDTAATSMEHKLLKNDKQVLHTPRKWHKQTSQTNDSSNSLSDKHLIQNTRMDEQKDRLITRRNSSDSVTSCPKKCLLGDCLSVTNVQNTVSRKRKSVSLNFTDASKPKLIASTTTYTRTLYEKKFDKLLDCKVKLEKLSSSFINRVLSGEKIPFMEENSVKQYDTAVNINFDQKNLDSNCISKHDCSEFETSNHDTWQNDDIDSWRNVRFVLKGKKKFDISKYFEFWEPEIDWTGWLVHVDSLHSSCEAYLHSISDGVTESRILVWDDVCKESISKHETVSKKVLENAKKEEVEEIQSVDELDSNDVWQGWNVIMADLNTSKSNNN